MGEKEEEHLEFREGYKAGYSAGFKDAMLLLHKTNEEQIKDGAMPGIRWP